jgi:hypothetical protein
LNTPSRQLASQLKQVIDMKKILVTIIFLISVAIVYLTLSLPFQYFSITKVIDYLPDNRYVALFIYKGFYVTLEELSRLAGMGVAVFTANIIDKTKPAFVFKNLSILLIMGACIGLFETLPFLIKESFSSPYGNFSSLMSMASHGILTIGAFRAVNEKLSKRCLIVILCIACHLTYNSVGPIFAMFKSDGFEYAYTEQLKWMIRIIVMICLASIFWIIRTENSGDTTENSGEFRGHNTKLDTRIPGTQY